MQDDTLPLIVDGGYEELAQLHFEYDGIKWGVEAALETEKVVRKKVGVEALTMQKGEAAEYLSKLIPLAIEETLKLHSAYGRLRWLWYIRRTPSELLEGEYTTTLGYDRALAEAITWEMPESDVEERGRWMRYPINQSTYRSLCRFLGRVKLISELQVMYRRVGKGARLDLTGPHLVVINDDRSEEAIGIYDQRHEKEHCFSGRGYGLSPEPFDIENLNKLGAERIPRLWLVSPCQPIELPIDTEIPGGRHERCKIRVRHIPWIADAKTVLDPLEMGDDWEMAIVRPVASAVQLSMALPLFLGELEWGLGNCLQMGYFITQESRAERIMDGALPEINRMLSEWYCTGAWPTTYRQWREAALSFVSKIWPLESAGFVRLVGENSVLIDAVSMTLALDRGLSLDRSQSKIANLRADLYEQQCQSFIDESQWRPTPDLARLRGKTLRRNKRHITDIDAVGSFGDTLLCVSCKSLVYDAAYDRGDYNVVQNAKKTIDDAVERWSLLMNDFRENPRGDNFDFSEYSKIIGVVCTPYVVYTESPESLGEVASGLRACVSINELRKWLNEALD